MSKSILSIDDLSDGDLDRLFCVAKEIKAKKYSKKFEAVMMTAFFEPSTRTRLSFEMAAHRLGIKVSTFTKENSSMIKGEDFRHTMSNLKALNPDVLVVRAEQKLEQGLSNIAVINAGDGVNEHPSQALLDSFTLLEHFQCEDLYGKRVLIMGDVGHSRVARSNIKLLKRLGASIVLLSPTGNIDDLEHVNNFNDLLGNFSAVMLLRLQKERIKDLSSYPKNFSLNKEKLFLKLKNCVVLHPGPMNIGEEIEEDVANCRESLIFRQVENGVHMRASMLAHCLS